MGHEMFFHDDTDYTNRLGGLSGTLVPFPGNFCSPAGEKNPINICSLARHFSKNVCTFRKQKCRNLLDKISLRAVTLPLGMPMTRFKIAGALLKSHRWPCASTIGLATRNSILSPTHLVFDQVDMIVHPSNRNLAAPSRG
jgi:hypothetical protein